MPEVLSRSRQRGTSSLAVSIASLPEQERKEAVQSLTEEEAESLLYDWSFWARPNQLPPDWSWYVWLLLSGRGGGKTRVGSETILRWAHEFSPIALVSQTKADARDTMVEVGDSSVLKVAPPWFMPEYESSKRRLTFPNGSIAVIYSGDEPDQLRGPQHQKAWVDELAKFRYPQDTWDNLMFGLRSGIDPQAVVTTTPRPLPVIKSILADPRTAVTKGHTMENAANLSPAFLEYVNSKYHGTRLGRQELAGEILDDNPGALWNRKLIDSLRVRECPDLESIVVAIDPEATNTPDSAETGILVVGIADDEDVPHAYVLEDLSLRGSPSQWGSAAITGYHKYHADKIVAEVNNGGDMVGNTILTIDRRVPVKSVRATRGKYLRAEPVSSLYEQNRVHHVGSFSELEDQMCEWEPGETSPDRLDALVWAITELILEPREKQFMVG